MKGLRPSELRELSLPQLKNLLEEERRNLFVHRRDLVFRRTNDTAGLKVRRHNIARINTLMHEIQIEVPRLTRPGPTNSDELKRASTAVVKGRLGRSNSGHRKASFKDRTTEPTEFLFPLDRALGQAELRGSEVPPQQTVRPVRSDWLDDPEVEVRKEQDFSQDQDAGTKKNARRSGSSTDAKSLPKGELPIQREAPSYVAPSLFAKAGEMEIMFKVVASKDGSVELTLDKNQLFERSGASHLKGACVLGIYVPGYEQDPPLDADRPEAMELKTRLVPFPGRRAKPDPLSSVFIEYRNRLNGRVMRLEEVPVIGSNG